MATGLFRTRDPSKVTRRPLVRPRAPRATRRERDDAGVSILRGRVAEHVAAGQSISDAAREIGISKSYGQKLFSQVREQLESHSPGQTQ